MSTDKGSRRDRLIAIGAAILVVALSVVILSTVLDALATIRTSLRPIDRDGLLAFAGRGRENPAARGTNKVHTVTEGQFRTLSYVGEHAPVVVDEPLHLFGQNTAPAPGEIVLSALGGCLAVGITAVATWKQVRLTRLELFLEGDIGNPAVSGTTLTLVRDLESGGQSTTRKLTYAR